MVAVGWNVAELTVLHGLTEHVSAGRAMLWCFGGSTAPGFCSQSCVLL